MFYYMLDLQEQGRFNATYQGKGRGIIFSAGNLVRLILVLLLQTYISAFVGYILSRTRDYPVTAEALQYDPAS